MMMDICHLIKLSISSRWITNLWKYNLVLPRSLLGALFTSIAWMALNLFHIGSSWSITYKTGQTHMNCTLSIFTIKMNRSLLEQTHLLNKIMQIFINICWLLLSTVQSNNKWIHLQWLAHPTKNWPNLGGC